MAVIELTRSKEDRCLHWNNQSFELRPASNWRERYALATGDVEVAVFAGKGWGKRPVEAEILGPEGIEPGLLLFTAFVVRSLAEDASAAAVTVTTTSPPSTS